ncbi:MAG TPA: PilN domain-containing protein [Kiloniellales bacterium]|nr:PilN domain-containing protein [Kiloniellales bacterium]
MARFPESLTESVGRFLRWWGGELAACLPPRVRAALGRSRPQLLVEIDEERARFVVCKGGEKTQLGEVSVTDADLSAQQSGPQRAAVAALIRATKVSAAEVVLRLPRDKVLRRMVDLPAAAAENLREVLGFEMDRHTPFKAEEVCFDFALAGTDPTRKRLSVDLAVVPRELAEQSLRMVAAWGLRADALTVADGDSRPARRFDLMPPGRASRSGSGLWRATLVQAVLALVLLAVAAYLPLRQDRKELAALEQEVARMREAALEADALKQEHEETIARSRYVAARKQRERPVTVLLDEVTRLLPDNTWVLQFSQRDDRLSLSGYSGRPSGLIATLEDSEMLTEVRFSSPVTLDQRVGLERFNLVATIVSRDTG